MIQALDILHQVTTLRVKHLAGQHNQQTHAGNRVAEKDFSVSGATLGTLHHWGSEPIESIDPGRLQSRDYGYYGTGFYTSQDPSFGRGTYGKYVTKLTLKPESKVLVTKMRPQDVDPEFVKAVVDHYYNVSKERAIARGRLSALEGELENIRTSPISWKDAVDRYARDKNVDAVKYGPGEIVIKNLTMVVIEKRKGRKQ